MWGVFATWARRVVAAGAISAAGLTTAAAQSGAPIGAILVEGEQRIEEATVLSYMTVQPGQPATAEDVNNSLRALFATGLFRDVRIDPRGADLVVTVDESPIINQIAIEGNRRIKDATLASELQSAPRRVYSVARAEADANAILEIYRRSGRYGAQVTPQIIPLDQNRVNLVFEVSEGDRTEIQAIRFVGNSAFSDARLRRAVSSDQDAWYRFLSTTTTYDEDRLELDKELLRKFYRSRGYADVEIVSAVAELSDDRSGFFLTFTLTEGPRYVFGAIDLASNAPGVDAASVSRLVSTRAGDVYNADLIEKTATDVTYRLGDSGFAFTRVDPLVEINRDALNVDVTYEINQGQRVYVERIEIQGNERTLDRVIRRQFELVEGDAFNAVQLQRSRSKIRALGYFSSVEVTAREGSAPDRVVVVANVQEKSTGALSFGLGFSSADSVSGLISLTETNLLGRGQYLRLSTQISGRRRRFDFGFTEPYFMGRDLAAGFDAYYTETDNQSTSSYDIRNIGFRPRVAFPIGEFSRLGLRYQISQDTIRNVPGTASGIIKQDAGSQLTSSIGYTLSYDRRNDPVDTTGGYRLTLSQDLAGLGGDAQYIRTEGTAKAYRAIYGDDVVASVELAGGAIVSFGDDIRTQDRFHLGGDSFRGFEYDGIGPRDPFTNDSLGGELYGVARAEITFPVGLPEELGIHGGIFSDVGTIYQLGDTSYTADAGNATAGSASGALRSINDGLELRATIGASIFWDSPIGPVRMNFATPLLKQDGDREEFFRFTAGTRF